MRLERFAPAGEKGSKMSMNHIGRSEAPLYGRYDTVIVGGGTAGSAAGISAATEGNRVLIVEKGLMLGGAATLALVTPMMDSYVPHERTFHLIEERLRREGIETRSQEMAEYVWSTPEAKADVLEDLFLEAGGEMLYDATLVDCDVVDGNIASILVLTSDGYRTIEAEQFVDASGDAWLSRLAGVEVDRGDDDGNNQMSSLRFEMGGIDVEAYRAYCLSLGDEFSPLVEGYFWESAMVVGKNFKLEPLFQQAVADGVLLPEDLVYYQCFSLPSRPGCLAFNCPHLSRLKNNADPEARSHAIVDGHRMIRRLVAFLTGYMPGFEHAYLLREASVLGVRESWRIRGLYQLTEEDYLARARFEDAVAKGDWYIDVHSATKGLVHMDKFEHGEYYEIPYRCLVNERIANMMTIGRCISTTFLVQASIRIQPTLIDMGHAAGVACARAHREGVALNAFSGTGLTTR